MSAPVRRDLAVLRNSIQLRWLVPPIAASMAAFASMVLVGIPVALAWLTTDHGTDGLGQLLRLVGTSWLAIQNVPVSSGAVTYEILPWGLAIVPIVLLAGAGRISGRATRDAHPGRIAAAVGVAALVYAVIAAGVSALASAPSLDTSTLHAGATACAIALATLGVSALRRTNAGVRALSRVPADAWTILRAAAGGISTLLGAGAMLALASLIWHFWQGREILEFIDAGVFGGLLVTLGGIGYLPVLILWSTSYLLGAGFAIGPGIGLSPFLPAPAPTQLPAFPVLAALPEQFGPMGWALPVAGVIAGIVIGLLVARGRTLPALVRLGYAAAACVLTGIGLGLLATLAQGSLGSVRLIHVGPDPVLVGLLAFGLAGVGAIPTALALRTVHDGSQESAQVAVVADAQPAIDQEPPMEPDLATSTIDHAPRDERDDHELREPAE